jgi:hypothetical protein
VSSSGEAIVVEVKMLKTREEKQVKLGDIVVGKIKFVQIEINKLLLYCL